MADTNTTPPTEEKKPKQTHGDVDKKILGNITLGEKVAAAAADPEHAAPLETEGLDGDEAAELLALCGEARDLTGKVVIAKKAYNAATQVEKAAHKALMPALRDIQQRAKDKFPKGDPKREAYCINKKNFDVNRDSLEQDAKDIIDLGAADQLRGLTAARITTARTKLGDWNAADDAQAKALQAQTKALKALDAKMEKVNEKRRTIQSAADSAWPYTDKANAPYRRAFKLPVDKPMVK